ncbi:MAG TPA: ABC transporter substrate-binding protein [Alphaproteobacteria bacterium]
MLRPLLSVLAVLAAVTVRPSAVLAEPSTMTPLRVGVISRTVFYVPVWAGRTTGLFAEQGLDVNVSVLDNGEKANEELRAGGLQVTIASTEGLIQDVEAGGPLRIVAGNAAKLPHFIIAQSRFKRFEDLKGATFGVLSLQEGTTFVLRRIAARHGLSPKDYAEKAVGGAPTRWRLLQAGAIDAGLQPFPLSYEAEGAGFTNMGPAFDYIADWQFSTINVNRDWAAANPATLERFLVGMLRATDWMYAHKDIAAGITVVEVSTLHPYAIRAIEDTIRYGILPRDLGISAPGLINVLESMRDVGLLPAGKPVQPEKYQETVYLERARAAAK